jgi:formate dehydrogenase iron-sulfur subunit
MSVRPTSPAGGDDVTTLIDQLLAEQRQLTAVERFSQKHADVSHPIQEKHYRELIPLSAPRPGEQYAFEVDLDQCSGCKACVTACHALNGLDDRETWREVGFLVGAGPAQAPRFGGSAVIPLQVTVTTACHHCLDPGCLNGCPVLAYEKDATTGIVRHLDDQCIGCSYCVMKCPYEVPKYSKSRGIVRKCDMCHGRLAEGEAPACVQSCPNEAISIRIVSREEFAGRANRNEFLADTPDAAITQPTTRYVSQRDLSGLKSAGDGDLRPQDPHWPLIWMLVFTQMGVGAFMSAAFAWPGLPRAAAMAVVGAAWVTLMTGLGASVFHLGQPLRAWRGFLGWRRSWMSREIIVFGALAGAASATAAAVVGPALLPIPTLVPIPGLLAATSLLGALAVACSAMIYVDTQRPFWNAPLVFTRFFGTTLLLGSALAAAAAGWAGLLTAGHPPAVAPWLAGFAMLVRTYLFVWDQIHFRRAAKNPAHSSHRPWRVIANHFPGIPWARFALFWVSSAFGVLAIVHAQGRGPLFATVSLLSTLASLILGRYLFFRAAVAPRMPGLPN